MQTMPSLRRDNRKVLVLAGLVVFLVIQALTGYLAARYSPTELEPALLASGVAQITQGRFDVYAVNQPLLKAL